MKKNFNRSNNRKMLAIKVELSHFIANSEILLDEVFSASNKLKPPKFEETDEQNTTIPLVNYYFCYSNF